MFGQLVQLVVLFLVIFDPFASLSVFVIASSSMSARDRKRTAGIAVLVALCLSLMILFFGEEFLQLFSTSLDEFRIAGGIILAILGVKMTLGHTLLNAEKYRGNSGKAIAAVIGTPLLTGPAAITAIIVSVSDYGRLLTLAAVLIVLFITAVLLFLAERVSRLLGATAVQVLSTMFGLVTLAWGVKFVTAGILGIFG
ncbi:MAG: MarC family protein [archaeon]